MYWLLCLVQLKCLNFAYKNSYAALPLFSFAFVVLFHYALLYSAQAIQTCVLVRAIVTS